MKFLLKLFRTIYYSFLKTKEYTFILYKNPQNPKILKKVFIKTKSEKLAELLLLQGIKDAFPKEYQYIHFIKEIKK